MAQRGALPPERARRLFAQLAAAITHCQERRVCHRDLKLENVLLGGADGDSVRLIDFGEARVHARRMCTCAVYTLHAHCSRHAHCVCTMHAHCMCTAYIKQAHVYLAAADGSADRTQALRKDSGTKVYSAPEVLAWSAREPGSRGYDGFAADMWSLGVVLFAMLVGLLPLEEASRDDPLFVVLRAAQRRGASATRALCAARKLPCKLPAPAIALVDSLLCVDPGCRPTIEEVGRHAWLAEPRPWSPLMAMLGGLFACIPAAKLPVARGL